MTDVLRRRSSIEDYLSKLTIERAKEDSQIIVYDDATINKGAHRVITNNDKKQNEQ
jgi:hypothetical protein